MMPGIERVELELGFVVIRDDYETVWPITKYIDCWGDECEPSQALALVITNGDRWYTVEMRSGVNPVIH